MPQFFFLSLLIFPQQWKFLILQIPFLKLVQPNTFHCLFRYMSELASRFMCLLTQYIHVIFFKILRIPFYMPIFSPVIVFSMPQMFVL